MTIELTWLAYTALLAATLWIPYIVGVNVTEFEGKETIFHRPPDNAKMASWVHRSFRAHLNLLEQLLPFSIIVLIAAIANISTPVTAGCAIVFFWLRVTHAVVMISGFSLFPLRPLIYVAGWITTLTYAWQILMRG
jgi:uncharacterized MAPEG superfamily protein